MSGVFNHYKDEKCYKFSVKSNCVAKLEGKNFYECIIQPLLSFMNSALDVNVSLQLWYIVLQKRRCNVSVTIHL